MSLPKIDVLKFSTPNKINNEPIKSSEYNKNEAQKDYALSKNAKYMIGATALAISVATGIIGYKNNWWRGSKNFTIEGFRKAGFKFKKGQAVSAKGKPFSGNITINKATEKYVLEYENGLLKKSSSYKMDFSTKSNELKQDIVKEYENGKLIKSTSKFGTNNYVYDKDSGKITEILHIKDNGSETLEKGFYYTKDGKLKYLYKGGDIVRFRKFTEFYDGTNRIKKLYNFEEPKSVLMYDKNGNLITEIYDGLKFWPEFKEYSLGYNRTQAFTAVGTRLRFKDKDCSIELNTKQDFFQSYSYTDIFKFSEHNKTPFMIEIETPKKTKNAIEFFEKYPNEKITRTIKISNQEFGEMSFNINEPISKIKLKSGEEFIYNRKTNEIKIPEGSDTKKEDVKKAIDEFIRISKLLKQKVREHKLYHSDKYHEFEDIVHEVADMNKLPHIID